MPRMQMIGLAVVGIVAIAVLAAANIRRQGRESAEAEISKINEEAKNEADHASSVFGRCIDDGGLFDFATSQCQRH